MPKITAGDLERQTERQALAESEAQTAIIKTLSGRDRESKERIVRAVAHILAADFFVPGIMDAVRTGAQRAHEPKQQATTEPMKAPTEKKAEG